MNDDNPNVESAVERVFSALVGSIVIGTMLGGGMVFALKAVEVGQLTDTGLHLLAASMVFFLVFVYACFQVARDWMAGFALTVGLWTLGTLSASACSIVCVQKGNTLKLPVHGFSDVVLPVALVVVAMTVFALWASRKMDAWDTASRQRREKRKNDEAAVPDRLLAEHPLEIDTNLFLESVNQGLAGRL